MLINKSNKLRVRKLTKREREKNIFANFYKYEKSDKTKKIDRIGFLFCLIYIYIYILILYKTNSVVHCVMRRIHKLMEKKTEETKENKTE